MYQFVDNLNFKIASAAQYEEHLECLVYAHYEFIRLHPFNNGNGRTGRILMNLIALRFGYDPIELYHREGAGRKDYIEAMRAGDRGDFGPLKTLIRKEWVSF